MKELHKRLLTGFLLGLLVIITLFFCSPWVFALLAAFLLALILITEWPQLVNYKDPFFWLITPLYPILPLLLIIYMQLSGYELMNMLLFSLVAIHDTGSYITGKLFGIHKIYPLISPGKTWEGFAGGVILTNVVSFLFFGQQSYATLFLLIIPFTITLCTLALCGDFFESYLKRRAGLKDSGALLPGHGGILDRIDGILFGCILVFALRHSLKTIINTI